MISHTNKNVDHALLQSTLAAQEVMDDFSVALINLTSTKSISLQTTPTRNRLQSWVRAERQRETPQEAHQISTADTAALQSQYRLKMLRKENLNILLRPESWSKGFLCNATSDMSHWLSSCCKQADLSPRKSTTSSKNPVIAIVKARAARFTSLVVAIAAKPFSCQYLECTHVPSAAGYHA
jgi:hypothetical protein